MALIALMVLAGVAAPGAARAAERPCPPPSALVVTDFSREFVQRRHLQGVSAPLVSNGTVRVQGDRIEWHVRSPVDILTTFGPDGVTQSIDGGAPEPVAAPTAVPGLGGLPLASLVRGDLRKLDAYFRVSTTVSAGNGPWAATLRPLDERLAAILGTIEIEGCAEVDRVTLRRPGGDFDVIQLSPGR